MSSTAVLTAPFTIELRDEAPRPLRAGEVRLRVEECGVCTSEVGMWTGQEPEELPALIGHEFSGFVTEVAGDVDEPRVGQRVAAWVPEGGGFGDETVVEARHCVPVGDDVPYAAVAEPLSCCVNAVELAAPALGDDVVIVGAGFMANLIQLLSVLKGARSVTVADLRPDALARAEALGATRVVDTSRESLDDAVREVTGGRGADVSYEVTGVGPGLEAAGDVLRMNGTLCIVGYHLGAPRAIPLGRWNWMALQLRNAHFREVDTIMRGMRAGLRLVEAGHLDAAQLISHTYALPQLADAFTAATEKPEGFSKAVVRPA